MSRWLSAAGEPSSVPPRTAAGRSSIEALALTHKTVPRKLEREQRTGVARLLKSDNTGTARCCLSDGFHKPTLLLRSGDQYHDSWGPLSHYLGTSITVPGDR